MERGAQGVIRAVLAVFLSVTAVPPRSLADASGPAEANSPVVALTGAKVVVGNGTVLPSATVIVRGARIDAVGASVAVPPSAERIDVRGMVLYPGLIDALSEQAPTQPASTREAAGQRPTPLHADATVVALSEKDAGSWRESGVLAANLAPGKGIFRGRTVLMLLGGDGERRVEGSNGAMNMSLQGLSYRNRVPGQGELGGEFPSRLIGVFGFVRQTLLDARYLDALVSAGAPLPPALDRPEARPSLDALRPVSRREMPLIFPAKQDRELRRALALAEELNVKAIFAGGYEAGVVAEALKARRIPVLVSLNFPEADKDVHPEFRVPLRKTHYWQRAPGSAGELARAGVRVAFYSDGVASGSHYLRNLRRAVREGMTKDAALRAATLGAAQVLGVDEEIGSVEAGKLANLVVADGDLFAEATSIRRVFVAGRQYEIASAASAPRADRAPGQRPVVADPFEALTPELGPLVLIKNADIMTVSHGTLKNASILIRDGKIAGLGSDVVTPPGARVIDGKGLWITPGFIDCHVHNGTDSHNESGANITSLTGTQDTLYPGEIGVYRTLAAGVTTANILHGSVNVIGGKTVVIKNRWRRPAEELIFKGAKPGLKFAINESPPRAGETPPSSFMGVQAFLREALTRARHYSQEWDDYNARKAAGNAASVAPRRDLSLEPLVEVLRGERFVHVHTYSAEAISLVAQVAEEFGFRIRTFQHAQDAFKIAEEIARHGGGVSIFADLLVTTHYNAAILMRKRVLVSVNSDGWQNARHFNQDVGRLMKYGDLSEDEALALITLNPAKQLGIDDRVGSIDVGKDADLVVFNRYPLSVYAVAQMVLVDGKLYFSREAEREREQRTEAEAKRLAALRSTAVLDAH